MRRRAAGALLALLGCAAAAAGVSEMSADSYAALQRELRAAAPERPGKDAVVMFFFN